MIQDVTFNTFCQFYLHHLLLCRILDADHSKHSQYCHSYQFQAEQFFHPHFVFLVITWMVLFAATKLSNVSSFPNNWWLSYNYHPHTPIYNQPPNMCQTNYVHTRQVRCGYCKLSLYKVVAFTLFFLSLLYQSNHMYLLWCTKFSVSFSHIWK